MNIFVLDIDPKKAARYHCDRHVLKMIVETAQILCTVHHITDSPYQPPYKATHQWHPCVKWAAESMSNYVWLCKLGKELCWEYTYRYGGKFHKCEPVMHWCERNRPNIEYKGLTSFVQAMPEFCKESDAVLAYRKYYSHCKKHLHKWTGRSTPDWIAEDSLCKE